MRDRKNVFTKGRKEKIMADHSFNFDGGYELSKIGATWFVSYSYYKKIEDAHNNWQNVPTFPGRISIFNKTQEHHNFGLKQIITMDDARLDTNEIGLTAQQIKQMARELLAAGKAAYVFCHRRAKDGNRRND